MTREEAIRHFEYGVSHDIFSEPVTSYAKMAIAALREQASNESQRVSNTSNALDGWISVEERLPKEFVSVLVYMPEERPLPTVHEGFLAKEGVWYANHFDREPMEITHWMPPPEPPKEG